MELATHNCSLLSREPQAISNSIPWDGLIRQLSLKQAVLYKSASPGMSDMCTLDFAKTRHVFLTIGMLLSRLLACHMVFSVSRQQWIPNQMVKHITQL